MLVRTFLFLLPCSILLPASLLLVLLLALLDSIYGYYVWYFLTCAILFSPLVNFQQPSIHPDVYYFLPISYSYCCQPSLSLQSIYVFKFPTTFNWQGLRQYPPFLDNQKPQHLRWTSKTAFFCEHCLFTVNLYYRTLQA